MIASRIHFRTAVFITGENMENEIQENVMRVEQQSKHVFRNKNIELLDVVEVGDSTFVVPATPGTTYWAILRVGYETHDVPIEKDAYIDRVAEILEERDPERWYKFVNKKVVKTFKNNQVVEKQATDWRNRIELNIKMLCRCGDDYYGTRLRDNGHILRWEHDACDGRGGYCLRTKVDFPLVVGAQKRGRKKKDTTKNP